MSVNLIDFFAFESIGPGIENYSIYFDDVSGVVSSEYEGTDGELGVVTESQRIRLAGTIVGYFLSDDNSTIYEIKASYNTPFAYVFDSYPNTPAPPSCDLIFLGVSVVNESAEDANDGSISAIASTSYSGLEYSIDGVDYQLSGNFVNLAPGNYTVYARDANGCEIEQDGTIGAYSNPIDGDFTAGLPVVQLFSGNISKWNAAYNPIVVSFQRTDSNILSVENDGSGNINITIDKNFDTEDKELAETTSVVVRGTKYRFNKPAVSSSTVGGNTVFNFAFPFLGDDTGILFIEQARPNYKIEVEITSGNTLYNTSVITGSWSPDINGKITADLSAYLKSLVNANDDFEYDFLNWKDINRAASYTIRYREVWDGSDNEWYSAPYPMYVVYAAKQLGDIYGGNLAEYVPFYDEDIKAKFLTDFNEPSHWVGLPWDVSFIFSENIVGTELKLRTTSLDINRQPIGSGVINSFLLNEDATYLNTISPYKFLIQEGLLSGVIQSDLIEALGVNRLMLPGEPDSGVEYFKLQIYRGADEVPFFITEPLIVKLNRPCDSDPYIYIKWLNKLGGWNYWRFGHNQDVNLNVDNDVSIRRNVFDWANDNTINDIIRKSATKSIKFGASGLLKEDIIGLESLATSIKVQMLVKASPYQWHTVELNTGSFQMYNTRENLFDVKFSLSLPEINIQAQ